MTAETGPLRIVPTSHLGYPPTPSADDKALPHPQEQLLDARAGDMIVMHGECIHSGTANTSGHLRAYISTFVTRVGFPHRVSRHDIAGIWVAFLKTPAYRC